MQITITVNLTDELIERIVDQQSDYGVSAEEVKIVVTKFLKEEIGTENGLLDVLDQLDIFNY